MSRLAKKEWIVLGNFWRYGDMAPLPESLLRKHIYLCGIPEKQPTGCVKPRTLMAAAKVLVDLRGQLELIWNRRDYDTLPMREIMEREVAIARTKMRLLNTETGETMDEEAVNDLLPWSVHNTLNNGQMCKTMNGDEWRWHYKGFYAHYVQRFTTLKTALQATPYGSLLRSRDGTICVTGEMIHGALQPLLSRNGHGKNWANDAAMTAALKAVRI